MRKNHRRLGDLLIEAGLIDQGQLDKALEIQKKSGERLGKVIIGLGLATEKALVEVLEFQLGVPHIDLSAITVPREMTNYLPLHIAEKYQLIPIRKKGRKLTVAIADPTNFYAIDDVRMITGCEIETMVAAESEIMRLQRRLYGVRDLVEKAVSRIQAEDFSRVAEMQTADDAPIVNLVTSLIRQAIQERASDIHVEPQEDLLRVRYRVDGVLREVGTFPSNLHPSVLSRIKIMAAMDIAEKRLPQDGRIKMEEKDRSVDLRVSTLPTVWGEKAVLRILDRQAVVLDLNRLGFSAENLRRYSELYAKPYGMILVTGPTGSGKTTTLYSTLLQVNSIGRNIITLEDPVEFHLQGISQMQVNVKAGLTFAGGLRSILRQDPDMILVGEIRDGETADIAIRAAMTGHLVFSTLHTNDSAGAVTRLVDMGIEPFLLASSLLGIVAQRLVRALCPHCRERTEPDERQIELLGLQPEESTDCFAAVGCKECGHSGYKGRLAIHEVLLLSPALNRAIKERAGADEILRIARAEGMKTMFEDGLAKVRAGLTDLPELLRVTSGLE